MRLGFSILCFKGPQVEIDKILYFLLLKNSKWVWSGNAIITDCRQTNGTARRSYKLSKATSSPFPIKMIAKLVSTLSNVQQNIEQLQTPTMGITINNTSTTAEPP